MKLSSLLHDIDMYAQNIGYDLIEGIDSSDDELALSDATDTLRYVVSQISDVTVRLGVKLHYLDHINWELVAEIMQTPEIEHLVEMSSDMEVSL